MFRTKGTFSWKLGFFILLALLTLIFATVLAFLFRLSWSSEPYHFEDAEEMKGEASFTITTDRDRLNRLMEVEIANLIEDGEPPYRVVLTDEHVEFHANMQLLGFQAPIIIQLLPTVAQNGDLVLEVDSFSLGGIQLPIEHILQWMSQMEDIPEWVVFYPKERLVVAEITTLQVDERLSFRFRTFDLYSDQIEAEMIVHP
ncbi:YpmS family protein [Halalkalibacterium halodurans]|uniref:BH1181 protein n=1 Tax=Halalkalibacterium halodurans (strain ATCC BAA-125 / DSM 18197 / FERM 7344 / JCM 9153 / C-125) TaxID=272558 RepID=Q9KDN0_HALH5|nr:YpmS family protein [Halalkalibacterium halodurans]MDY7221707.1 YpmS family protein [Halalkalibacterium halodurans]MDY7240983.1 YpmS family protein [Halalkalibacterium halodurans]MED4124296.1 YpmS family protein [Halalkalibacterium halodurans]MED4173492.1 YpmS family protein [Halalkalibacterium halodurans]BAB04900.1 BH1181 [Halalkalibacterium halodurans C-125]